MSKILVAGAGHGGLVAAANLAAAGHDVTVIEKSSRAGAGHDWHDMMSLHAFDFASLSRPDKAAYGAGLPMCFYSPNKKVKLCLPFTENEDSICIDRKLLLSHLIDCAEERGVKFKFLTRALSAECENGRVTGLLTSHAGHEKLLPCDLLIDAAGFHSPVKMNLPDEMGIQKELDEKAVFHCYRAYFNKTADEYSDPPYGVHVFHCGRPGIDWVITEKNYIDVLIGKFGAFEDGEIEEALEDFREEYPYMGKKILRGGSTVDIPISRTLPMIVANGYAAVGDSACMTVPLNGSGINLSLKAGKLLAQTVLGADGEYTKEKLWGYQYRYNKLFGDKLLIIDMLRSFFSGMKAENIDFFLERGILTAEDFDTGSLSLTAGEVLRKIKATLPQAYVLPPLVKSMKGAAMISRVDEMLPERYDEKKLERWLKKYCTI